MNEIYSNAVFDGFFFFFSKQRTVLIGTGKKKGAFFFFPLVTQSCLTCCNLMDCSTSDASVHGILQTRILV